MDALAIELTAQIAEHTGGISESVCIVQEAVKTWVLTQKSLAKLNCRRGLVSQLDNDRETIIVNLPILHLIASQVKSFESIIWDPDAPEFYSNWVSLIDPNDPDDIPFLTALSPYLGRLGMARYSHDTEQYMFWKALLNRSFDLLKGQEIVIEYELKQDTQKKAYYDIRRLSLRKIQPSPSPEQEIQDTLIRSNIG